MRTQRKLSAAAREWSDASHDPSFLASGARLAQFEGWAAETSLAMNEEEAQFLTRSVEEREKQRRQRKQRAKNSNESWRFKRATGFAGWWRS